MVINNEYRDFVNFTLNFSLDLVRKVISIIHSLNINKDILHGMNNVWYKISMHISADLSHVCYNFTMKINIIKLRSF
jgi:hypothetical protein